MMPRHPSGLIWMSTCCLLCGVGQIIPESFGSSHVPSIAWMNGRLCQIPDLCAIEFLCIEAVQQPLGARELSGSHTRLA